VASTAYLCQGSAGPPQSVDCPARLNERRTGGGMLDRVLDFLTGRALPAVAAGADELALAVAALLIEAARMDDDFNGDERATIERLLTERFQLAPAALQALGEQA